MSNVLTDIATNFTVKLTLTQRMSSDPFCVCVCVTIDAMLNFDSEVDINTNAAVKCEQPFSHTKSLLCF